MNFNIVNLDRTLPSGAITTAHWTATLTDGEFVASSYGSVGLGEPGNPFIPYEEVTEAKAIEWTKAAMGEETVAALEAALAAQIEAQKNPTSAAGVPWANEVAPAE